VNDTPPIEAAKRAAVEILVVDDAGDALRLQEVQQALSKEHDLLRSVIDNMPDQVYLKDADSRFVSVNPVTARFFGASSPEEIAGKSDFDFFPHELAAQFLAEEREILHRAQPCLNREVAIKDAAGNTRWVLTTKVPLRDRAGNITGLLGINRDITERREAEEAIRRLNIGLEQRVAARTRELHEAMSRLEEQDRARAEFVSTVSHELKAPLMSMKCEIANLLQGVLGPVPDPVTRYLQMLHMDCQRMAGTVEDILDLSRLESRTMRLSRARLPFHRLVARAAAALAVQAQNKNIEIVLSLDRGPGFVECDAAKTERAIVNIIGNAIKFTPDGGRVEIGLHGEATRPAALVAEITDNGIGIAAQDISRVTEKYFRADEQIGGTGLGLAIAKEILELHGGRLTVRSPPPGRERGTRVSVSLPAASPPTLLIANHDEPTRDLLDRQMRSCGYRVVACADGEGTLDVARRNPPDAGIVEFPASATGGENLVFRMKADPSLQTIPLVALAGGAAGHGTQEILNGLKIPALPIPWREEDLLDSVEAAIRGAASTIQIS
jgi:PAS domain S-box-containing protein